MSDSLDVERTEKEYSFIIYTFFTILLILLLGWIFILNLGPQSNIAITNNDLVLLSIIVVLVLSFRFTELQIPGLKLKRTVEALQKEAESLRELMIHLFSYSSSQASASANVNLKVEQNQVRELGIDKIPDEIKLEVNEIEESDRDPGVVFIELVSGIERKLVLLSERFLGGTKRYRPIPTIAKELKKEQIIDEITSSLIFSFWSIRNQIIHGQLAINRDILSDATQIGGKIMAKLMQIYGPILLISPVTGLIGDKIKVSGAAFSANNTVSIYFDFVNAAALLTEVKTDDDGLFNMDITVPPASAGQHYLWTRDELTGIILNISFQVMVDEGVTHM